MQAKAKLLITLLLFHLLVENLLAQALVLDSSMHLIRSGDQPEWEEFTGRSPQKELTIKFTAQENTSEQTLQIRQYEVKQDWQVVLNGNKLRNLVTDINDMIIYIGIPSKRIVSGENTLQILPATEEPDDIMVGEIILHDLKREDLLAEASVILEVTDKKNSGPIPCRITIVNDAGILQTTTAASTAAFALRPGNIYTLNGKLSIGLPAGKYTIYAGHGFEYSVDSVQVDIKRGEQLQRKLVIGQEVATNGWISSDPHIHTYTYSGHGDATIEERMISIAGEGIELPVITDHNIKVDVRKLVDSMSVEKYFSPVTGMEFTTNLGHFNVFPVATETPVPLAKLKDWNTLADSINPEGRQIVILNHARDIHVKFRPFDPSHHVSVAGKNLDGWKFPANAIELINSGSLQTDIFQLYRDWFGMMNRGHFLSPVGSSDSHDVSRYLVGQARTYIKCAADNVQNVNRNEALNNFHSGKVAVSLGLFTEIIVNDKFGPGELAPISRQVKVTVKVQGPGWTNLSKVSLYVNGKKIREASITNGTKPGIKWEGSWMLPKFRHDVFLVAIAEGPYHHLPFWPLVKPYQPRSPKWTPGIMGSTGAAWIDSDGDGSRTCARKYATDTWKKSNGDINKFIDLLQSFDEAVAVQAASLLQEKGWSLKEPRLQKAISRAKGETRSGFQKYSDEWDRSVTVQ